MKTKLISKIVSLFIIAMVSYQDVYSQVPGEHIDARWRNVLPSPDVVLKPGDKVYIFVLLEAFGNDPFNGFYQVDEHGMVHPKFCKNAVNIGGMSESDASEVVLQHAIKHNVYQPRPTTKIRVIYADRLPQLLR